MVGGVPFGLALRDLFYAAGLGFILCAGYSAARLVLGSGRAACFICDTTVLALGALLYRSAAMSRFYAGQPRWYTMVGCGLCFLACRAAVAPLFSAIEAVVRWALAWPFVMLYHAVLAPVICAINTHREMARVRRKTARAQKKQAAQKKRLQKAGRVLYNSK